MGRDYPVYRVAVLGGGLVMAAIYQTVLAEIRADGMQVLTQRTSLTPLRKLWIAWRTWVKG